MNNTGKPENGESSFHFDSLRPLGTGFNAKAEVVAYQRGLLAGVTETINELVKAGALKPQEAVPFLERLTTAANRTNITDTTVKPQ